MDSETGVLVAQPVLRNFEMFNLKFVGASASGTSLLPSLLGEGVWAWAECSSQKLYLCIYLGIYTLARTVLFMVLSQCVALQG